MSQPAATISYSDTGQRYSKFKKEVFRENLGEVSSPGNTHGPESELEMQARWFAGEFGRKFISTDGKKIEIIQFGHWNHSAGPDFTEVAIRIDDRKLTGTLEVDLNARSWEAHGHAINPEFESVVLHVFLDSSLTEERFFSRTAEHREVTQIALNWSDLDDWGPRPWNHLPEAHLGRCATPLRGMSAEKLDTLFTAAAQYRLQNKTRRLTAVAEIHGADEAIYQAIAEALGYRYNKLPMRVLAQRLPLKTLLRLKPLEREAQLFGTAAHIDLDHFIETPDPHTRVYLKELWSKWWKVRDHMEPGKGRLINWHLAGIRPLNHPQRRLGALASIINTWPTLQKILHQPEKDPTPGIKKIRAYFSSLDHPFWNQHYTLRSKPLDKAMALVGRDRAEDILGNVLFPWLMRDHPDYWNQYIQATGSQMNEKLRRAVHRLFGNENQPDTDPRKWVKNFYSQQALLQIYTDFCLEDSSDCENCPFPEQLSQW